MDDQEEIINKLTERIKAEQETASELRRQNDLAEQSLKSLERTKRAEAQRTRLWLDIAEQTAGLVQQLPEALYLLHGYDEKLSELEELSERLDRIERALVLLLSLSGGKGNRQAEAITRGIEQDQQRRLVEQLKRRLDKLEVKRASYGLEAPPHLLMEIEDLKSEIEQLEQ
jgi:hypothetical protein